MASLLPSFEGYLPLYILFVGVTAIGNALQCYTTLSYTQRLYSGSASGPNVKNSNSQSSPVTPLSSRTFGTWTLAVGIVRVFAAYHINEASWYHMQMLTNVIGLVHFGLEAFVYKTTRPSGPWFAPVSVALIGTIWSIAQYDYYVR
ncbi:ergosterol biosynthesis protein [Exophiala dermatitidis]|uniref:Ergosterol biosynthesis protein n=1 Tax=Exophiala dermatitidis TaxID=5970 RepID=A0AAN6F1P9_EXODE|nr:ergosterol biosynthesis protein [Exophiala dermatitidis]KAJ4526684.1 ergosterol biosynthesis protein [Exophiala dermatitidis]KAJ4532066.1 ergosterol biosynthesis protein [Exophiala dermatitidis]KAJ4546100.1 ergosterol biosynthesis protein [Exophiala dermatitidis]KAJ4567654.1 ergosterol biosynthesis protein [Exophiala dermatitidis]